MANTEEVKVAALVDTKGSETSIRSLRKEVVGFKNDLTNLQRGTEEYNNVLRQLAQRQSQLNAINQDVRASTLNLTDVYRQLSSVASGVVAGFTAVRGAAALLGGENEALSQTFVKLQAGMALIQSLTALSNGIKAANVAFKAFNVTLAANPIGAVLVGVTALVGVFAKLGNAVSSSRSGVEELTISNDEFNSSIERQNDELEYNIRLLRAQGETEQQINITRRQELANTIAKREELLDSYRDELAQLEALGDIDPVAKWLSGYNRRIKALQGFIEQQQKLLQSDYDAQSNLNTEYTERALREENSRRKAQQRAAERASQERASALEAQLQYEFELQQRHINRLKQLDQERRQSIRDSLYEIEQDAATFFDDLEEPEIPFIDKLVDFSKPEAVQERINSLREEADRLKEIFSAEGLGTAEGVKAWEDYIRIVKQADTIEDQFTKNQEKQKQDRLKIQAQQLQATAGFLSASASLLGENTVAAKALGVASATISTYTGAAQVLANPLDLNPFTKWANFAATIATGLAAVKNILSTNVPGASDVSSASVSAVAPIPSFPEPMGQIVETETNINGFDEDVFNQMSQQFVPVLVEEDVSRVQTRVRTAESGGTFQ